MVERTSTAERRRGSWGCGLLGADASIIVAAFGPAIAAGGRYEGSAVGALDPIITVFATPGATAGTDGWFAPQ